VTLQLRYVAHSEIGPIRKNNQDSGFASPHLLVVADGMGGAAAGDLASAVAIDTVRHVDPATSGEEMLTALGSAVGQANERIAHLVDADPSLDGMGTTLTGALFDGVELGLVHIGDSRAYRLREGSLERLTHDHSWVQSLVDDGKISESDAAIHPHRSLLLKVLNGQPANDPDLTLVPVAAGDRLMFCSDGVCGLIEDDEIEAALRLPELDAAVERLVSEALAEGGIDNITVIVADVVEADGTDVPVVLGAAGERTIPTMDGPAPEPDSADEEEDTVEASAARQRTVAEDDESRYLPQPPARRRLFRPLVGLLVLLLVAAAGLGGAYAWVRTQFYVGAAGERVAIYQGLADSLPAIPLSRVYESQPLALAALPPYYAEQVRSNIEVPDLESARATVSELTAAAERCATPSPTPTPTPARTVSPSPVRPTPSVATTPPAGSSATPVVTLSPGPTPGPSLTPTPTPSPSGGPVAPEC
jgi:serine/threonine protein phosphatase PrpC